MQKTQNAENKILCMRPIFAQETLFFAENALRFYGSVALYCFQNKNGAKISLDITNKFPGRFYNTSKSQRNCLGRDLFLLRTDF